ncbi:MAG: 2Fe-2S iron-sulfur cluster binding domain-containing protein [Sphingomonadales bacterium]|nr:2Fe-2S iron-sulfur cluster binding domain-containing protein [Sphingomonadales bacterium]
MVAVTFIEADGARFVVDCAVGGSLMEAARAADIKGILADCGGNCACGTCRVFVDEGWLDRLAPIAELEEATLDMRDEPQANERLSCQLPVTEAMDGMVVRLPKRQF